MPKDSTVADLEELTRKARGTRQRHEPTWFLNLSYYQGNQWVFWNRGRLYEPKLDPHRVTFTDNRIIGVVRTETAKMTKQRPVFIATPTTADQDDVEAARLGERMLTHLFRKLDLERKQRSAIQWSRICGAGFWKLYWDAQAGDNRDVLVGPDGQPVIGQDGRPLDPSIIQQLPPEMAQQVQVKSIAMGEVCVEVRSPLEILVDPLAGDEGLTSAEFLIEDSVRSADYVQSRYGKELKEDADAIPGVSESRMGGLSGIGDSSGTYKGVRIFEYWAPKSSKYPNGRHAIWAQDQLLHEGENPYGGLPYVMFTGTPVPGRFWPTCTVEQVRPVQDELNKTLSQVRENAARIGNPSMVVSRMANVQYSGLPGEKIEYDDTMPNSVPQYLQAPEMPAYVIDQIQRMENSIADIAGQHEVSQGNVPPGVTAASAINLLQEQDDTKLGPEIADMENTLAEAGTMLLKIVAQFYEEERAVHIAGDDGDWDIFSFKGSQLKDTTHVEVQAGSAIPQSKAAKQANMQNLLTLFIQNGVPLSKHELSRFLRDMEVGGYEALVQQMSEDEAQINGEHRRLAEGNLLPVNTYDDDDAHIDGHTTFQKGARYNRLPDQVKLLFEQHVDAHRQRAAQAAQEQTDQQVEMQGRMARAEATAKEGANAQYVPIEADAQQAAVARYAGPIAEAQAAAQARHPRPQPQRPNQPSGNGNRK